MNREQEPKREHWTYILQLEPDDWEALRDLKIESLQREPIAFEDYESGMARYLSRTEEEWRQWLSHPNRIALFAKADGKYVGMVSAFIGDNTAMVQHMYVDKSQRGKGISRDLLNTLLAVSSLQGAKQATLGVLESQTAAIGLYRSLGFVATESHEVTRSGKHYNEILMEKVL